MSVLATPEPSYAPSGHWMRWSAGLGAAAWLAAIPMLNAWGKLGWAEAALLFAALVIVPLGFGLIEMPAGAHRSGAAWRWARYGQLPAALLLGGSLGCPLGWAVALSMPYLLIAGLAAVAGVGRLWHHGRYGLSQVRTSELCVAAALIYLPDGAIWHLLALSQQPVFGFEPIMVRLTAVHLHYVGFSLPLLTGMALREGSRRSRAASFVASCLGVGVIVGFPTVAAAMTIAQHTAWRGPELITVLLLAAMCWLLAGCQMLVAVGTRRPAVLMLLGVSSASLATAMGLAVVYSSGLYFGTAWLDLKTMLSTHGVLQMFGFALCGLLAWHVRPAEETPHAA